MPSRPACDAGKRMVAVSASTGAVKVTASSSAASVEAAAEGSTSAVAVSKSTLAKLESCGHTTGAGEVNALGSGDEASTPEASSTRAPASSRREASREATSRGVAKMAKSMSLATTSATVTTGIVSPRQRTVCPAERTPATGVSAAMPSWSTSSADWISRPSAPVMP